MSTAAPEKISPTAYATGSFWVRHGLSHPALATPQGKRVDRGFRLLMALMGRRGARSFGGLMLARHRGIDARLTDAIEAGQVTQVIELAAGLSGRGWRFKQRYGDRLTYIETDLPHMAAEKRRLLEGANLLRPGHRVVDLDVLADTGRASLAGVAATLDPRAGTAIITEGLMNYLDPAKAQAVWRRIAQVLKGFPQGLYLADAYLKREHRSLPALVFGTVLSAFVRGRMHIHFDSPAQATALLRQAGFATAQLHEPRTIAGIGEAGQLPGADRVRVLEARSSGSA